MFSFVLFAACYFPIHPTSPFALSLLCLVCPQNSIQSVVKVLVRQRKKKLNSQQLHETFRLFTNWFSVFYCMFSVVSHPHRCPYTRAWPGGHEKGNGSSIHNQKNMKIKKKKWSWNINNERERKKFFICFTREFSRAEILHCGCCWKILSCCTSNSQEESITKK